MNIEQAAALELQRVKDRLQHSRQALGADLIARIVRDAFAAGVVYGVGRAQHAVAITRTAIRREHPEIQGEPFNDGAAYGVDRAQQAIVETHTAALAQAAS